jgi:hypothetical protein
MVEAEGEEDREAEIEDVGPEKRGEAAEGDAKAVDENASFAHVLVSGLGGVGCGFGDGLWGLAAGYQGCGEGEGEDEFAMVGSCRGFARDGKAHLRG